tara:strand:+ start:433 stop:1233 length:801 start_codon:yes stop_codon:yes gene_type:complete
MEKIDLISYEENLNKFLRLNTFPVAIKFLKNLAEIPERTKRPLKDLKNQFTTCQAIGMARKYGWVIALGKEDSSCVLGAMALGLEKKLDHYNEGNLCINLYTENLNAGRISEESVPRLNEDEYVGIIVGPLNRTSFIPDCIVVYGNSAQIMRLGQAWLWKRGGTMSSEFRGRIDCADIAIAPFIYGKPQMIVPCTGDRIFGQVQDHEIAFSFPFDLSNEIMEGLEGTHKAGGARYPVTNWMNYTGHFPSSYENYREMIKEENEEKI